MHNAVRQTGIADYAAIIALASAISFVTKPGGALYVRPICPADLDARAGDMAN
jgi:hypothetical protein